MEIKKTRAFKTFSYRGKTLDELINMPFSEFAKLATSSVRRHLLRGLNEREKSFLREVTLYQEVLFKTDEHPAPIVCKESTLPILPMMVGTNVLLERGNGKMLLEVKPQMIGKRFRDYISTRVYPSHGKRTPVGAISKEKFVPYKA